MTEVTWIITFILKTTYTEKKTGEFLSLKSTNFLRQEIWDFFSIKKQINPIPGVDF